MKRRDREADLESFDLAVAYPRALLVSALRPTGLTEQEKSLSPFSTRGFKELVRRNIAADFAGTVVAGYYRGDMNTREAHYYADLTPESYRGTLSRLTLAGTYKGELVTYDDFKDNPRIAANTPWVMHYKRMLLGRAMQNIAAQLTDEERMGWSVLRDAESSEWATASASSSLHYTYQGDPGHYPE